MDVFALLLKITIPITILCSVFIVGNAIYNITFHPLAKFPGPAIYGASSLPAYYDLYIGDSASRTLVLHEKYGHVVRMTPNDLSFSSAQAWQDIYGHRKGHKDLERDPRFFFVDPAKASDIIASNDANHARMKKLMLHAFSESALRDQEPIILSYCDLLIQRLSEKIEAKEQVDMAAWLNFASFDIIGDLTFGEPFHALENGEYHWWMATIFRSFKLGVLVRTAKGYLPAPLGGWLYSALEKVPAIKRIRAKHRNFIRNKTINRLAQETDRQDFTAVIMRHNDEKGMSEKEMIANAASLIIGGSESTATLLSGLTFHLLTNPRVLALLQQETRAAFTSQSAMSFAAVSQLPYLQACIDETLRLYPPVPSGLPRMVPAEGMIIDGHFVHGNTSVGVHQLSASRSERNFKDPLKFVPERWLKDEFVSPGSLNEDYALRYGNDELGASQPFAIGSRGCIGKKLAYAEMRSIMTRLIWNFDMELQPNSLNWDQQKVYVLWSKPPLNVRLSSVHERTKYL